VYGDCAPPHMPGSTPLIFRLIKKHMKAADISPLGAREERRRELVADRGLRT